MQLSEGKKIVLVTGASRGIGKAISENLGRQGFFVIGTATSPQGAAKIEDNFSSQSIAGVAHVCDVALDSSVEDLFAFIKSNFSKGIDVLVNNAGITRDNLFLRMNADEWLDVINTNLNSIFRLAKASVKSMVKKKYGKIINISSVVGDTGNSGQTNYSAAKSGISGFTKSLALELGKRNITVNSVAPGFIATDMTDNLSAEHKLSLSEKIPLSRLGTPEEIAGVVGFLSSSAADYITGQTIHVNGGMYMN